MLIELEYLLWKIDFGRRHQRNVQSRKSFDEEDEKVQQQQKKQGG